MATVVDSNVCSTCKKSSARCFCIGCKQHFCSKHFKEHEQQLSLRFDDEIVRSHDELLFQLQNLNSTSPDLFDQIEQWKLSTIDRVEKAAQRARHELIELIDRRRTQISKQVELIKTEICDRRAEENFLEHDIDRIRAKINEIKYEIEKLTCRDTNGIILVNNHYIDWDRIIYIRDEQVSSPYVPPVITESNPKWIQNGVTVAGGSGYGSGMSKLYHPWGLYVDDRQNIYIVEYSNHRVVEWKCGATNSRIIAGGNGQGNRTDQLSCPTGLFIDKKSNTLLICDSGNKRIVRWPLQDGTHGETIISNVGCQDFTIDDDGFIYIVDYDQHEVRKYRRGESQGTLVAGGNGPGSRFDQLNHPRHVYVDRDHSLYIVDSHNHRVVKWTVGAKQGIIVAGGQGAGSNLSQLSFPYGALVDQLGTVYVADYSNHRIMRWNQQATEGTIVVGGNGGGSQANQLYGPICLSFDGDGNLYVSDYGNFQVKKFNIDRR